MESDNCLICGRRPQHTHHLVNGRGKRDLAEADNLKAKLCLECHNAIHNDGNIERKSKQLGEALYKLRKMVLFDMTEEQAQASFLGRYGKKYI